MVFWLRDYAQEFEKLKGDPRKRVLVIAWKFGVRPATVTDMLRRWWGVREHERRVGKLRTPFPISRDELVTRLNKDGRWKSRQAVQSLADKLGVSKRYLTTKMTRWRVIRGPYVIDD